MDPAEEAALLQHQRAVLIERLEIANRQLLTQPGVVVLDEQTMTKISEQAYEPEPPASLEAKIREKDIQIADARARQAERTQELIEGEGRVADAEMKQTINRARVDTPSTLEKTFAEVGAPQEKESVDLSSPGGAPNLELLTSLIVAMVVKDVVQPLLERAEVKEGFADISKAVDDLSAMIADMAKELQRSAGEGLDKTYQAIEGLGAKLVATVDEIIESGERLVENARDSAAELGDQTMADMFPNPTKELEEMAARHVQEQQDLQKQTDTLTAKYLDEHPAADDQQRAAQEAALEAQAQAAQEALRAQQAAEAQRMMEIGGRGF